MKMLFVADLHYGLKQFDWLIANASAFDVVGIGGDLLDLGSSLDLDTQIVVVEKYLNRIFQCTELLVSPGNHDGDAHNASQESVCRWLPEMQTKSLHVDGDGVEIGDILVTICPWWDGDVTRAEVEQLIERDASRQKQIWVWIHHSPPDGSPVSWTGRASAGDQALTQWIARFHPDLVLGRCSGRCMSASSTSSTMPKWSWPSYCRFTSIRYLFSASSRRASNSAT